MACTLSLSLLRFCCLLCLKVKFGPLNGPHHCFRRGLRVMLAAIEHGGGFDKLSCTGMSPLNSFPQLISKLAMPGQIVEVYLNLFKVLSS